VVAVRGVGLWAGIDVDPRLGTGREVSEGLVRCGVLVKDTHGSTVRLSPPLVITEAELAFAVDALAGALGELRCGHAGRPGARRGARGTGDSRTGTGRLARGMGDSRAGTGRLARGNRATRGRGAASRPVRGAESWGLVALRRG
jgi:hypothetical protein